MEADSFVNEVEALVSNLGKHGRVRSPGRITGHSGAEHDEHNVACTTSDCLQSL
jgi:hypothetical protein